MHERPRIAIVGTTPWLLQGLAEALSDAGRWQITVLASDDTRDDSRDDSREPAGPPADAYVLHATDETEALRRLAALPPAAPVLCVGATAGLDAPLREARAASPHAPPPRPLGLLPSDADATQLRAALAAVLAGLSVRAASAAAFTELEMPGSGAPPRAGGSPVVPLGERADLEVTEALTSRELQVFELLAKGLSNRDIAGVLGISSHTAKFHVAQILGKVGAATRAEAVALGLRLGLIGL